MEERTKKIDIADLLPRTMEIGGKTLSLIEIGEKKELPSSERCRVFCYDICPPKKSINFIFYDDYSRGNYSLLGVTPATEEVSSKDGVNLFVSCHSGELPTFIITFEPNALYDGKQFNERFFNRVWFADRNGLHEHDFRRLLLKYHDIVFIPVPPLEEQPGTGGVLIIRPEYLLKSEKPELDRLLAGRKFNY